LLEAVAVIAKAPEPGKAKTRLCPPLTEEQAAGVAASLLADSHAAAVDCGAEVWCVYEGDERLVRQSLPAGARLLAQRGTRLAERLAAAQADLFASGYDRVMVYGADCPTVDAAYLRAAFDACADAEAVLGPATDGGYTLLAATRATPALFDGVVMSTERVLADTLARARRAGVRTAVLQPRRDLDTTADLVDALEAGALETAPHTAAAAAHLAAATRDAPPR
jgi:rSAM/selenodomain-associated transferase 1